VGRAQRVTLAKRLRFLEISPAASREGECSTYRFADISRLDVGDGYLDALHGDGCLDALHAVGGADRPDKS
jgi:hypothetical protein